MKHHDSISSPTDHIITKNTKLVAAIALTGALTAGCGSNIFGNSVETNTDVDIAAFQEKGRYYEKPIAAGFAAPPAGYSISVRYDPIRLEPTHIDPAQDSNACLVRDEAILFEDFDGIVAEHIDNSQDGAFVGFPLDVLPDDVQNACRDDKNGIVWISNQSLPGIDISHPSSFTLAN